MQGETFHEPTLVKEMAGGSSAAFQTLYYRYFEAVRLNVLKITGDEAMTEDILQEVFSGLWDKRERFAKYDKISAWLFVASYNRSINHIKQRAALRARIQQATIRQVAEGLSDDYKAQEERFHLLEEAINQLPPQRKRVFELCRLQGLSYEQAAAELSITRNTVKDHLVKAMESIRQYVQEKYPNDPHLAILLITLTLLSRE